MKRDHIEFQDRSVAKAYFISFRCFGTWLHGDERGSVDRRFYNRIGTPKIQPNAEMVSRKASQMKQEPFVLQARERSVVDSAIREVCLIRCYELFAVNVRTNHAHVVVSNSARPERIMDALKANATRALREKGMIGDDFRPWSRHGSTRYLWTDEHVAQAVEYVVNGQGDELPRFDSVDF